jgi:hypothetical protein
MRPGVCTARYPLLSGTVLRKDASSRFDNNGNHVEIKRQGAERTPFGSESHHHILGSGFLRGHTSFNVSPS